MKYFVLAAFMAAETDKNDMCAFLTLNFRTTFSVFLIFIILRREMRLGKYESTALILISFLPRIVVGA